MKLEFMNILKTLVIVFAGLIGAGIGAGIVIFTVRVIFSWLADFGDVVLTF